VEHKPFPEHKYNKVIEVYLIDQILCHEHKVSKDHFTYTNYGNKTKIDSASRLCGAEIMLRTQAE
jgi:hypothetical protein